MPWSRPTNSWQGNCVSALLKGTISAWSARECSATSSRSRQSPIHKVRRYGADHDTSFRASKRTHRLIGRIFGSHNKQKQCSSLRSAGGAPWTLICSIIDFSVIGLTELIRISSLWAFVGYCEKIGRVPVQGQD